MAHPNVAPWLSLVLAAGCVADKPIGPGQRCPCVAGWICDQAAQVCVLADAAAPMMDAARADTDPDLGSDGPPAPAPCGNVSYPAQGFYGTNVFAPGVTSFVSNTNDINYEVAADLVLGATVTVKMTMGEHTLSTNRVTPEGLNWPDVWILLVDGQGWLSTKFDEVTGQQVFQSQGGLLRPEREIVFGGTGEARIDYYECDSPTPTRSKTITWARSPAPSAGD